MKIIYLIVVGFGAFILAIFLDWIKDRKKGTPEEIVKDAIENHFVELSSALWRQGKYIATKRPGLYVPPGHVRVKSYYRRKPKKGTA